MKKIISLLLVFVFISGICGIDVYADILGDLEKKFNKIGYAVGQATVGAVKDVDLKDVGPLISILPETIETIDEKVKETIDYRNIPRVYRETFKMFIDEYYQTENGGKFGTQFEGGSEVISDIIQGNISSKTAESVLKLLGESEAGVYAKHIIEISKDFSDETTVVGELQSDISFFHNEAKDSFQKGDTLGVIRNKAYEILARNTQKVAVASKIIYNSEIEIHFIKPANKCQGVATSILRLCGQQQKNNPFGSSYISGIGEIMIETADTGDDTWNGWMNKVNEYVIDFDSNVNAWTDVWTNKETANELGEFVDEIATKVGEYVIDNTMPIDNSYGGMGYYADVGSADFYLG